MILLNIYLFLGEGLLIKYFTPGAKCVDSTLKVYVFINIINVQCMIINR